MLPPVRRNQCQTDNSASSSTLEKCGCREQREPVERNFQERSHSVYRRANEQLPEGGIVKGANRVASCRVCSSFWKDRQRSKFFFLPSFCFSFVCSFGTYSIERKRGRIYSRLLFLLSFFISSSSPFLVFLPFSFSLSLSLFFHYIAHLFVADSIIVVQ